jgi:dTDP-4-amino-4,6-dideoxygalactose transaminase
VSDTRPAALGGPPAFPEQLPLVRPTIPDIPGLAARIQTILESGMLTNDRTVRELEDRAAEFCEVDHVVAVSNCTAGLMLTLQALGAAGRVVMPSMTFSASAHAVVWSGGTPVWGEVSPRTMTLDPLDAAMVIDGAVAMTATHVYGAPCDVESLQVLADDAGIPLVYDAAHALGSKRKGRPIGCFGTAEVFSMSPTKVAVAGEGGLIATRDADLADRLRIARDYGNPGTYDCEFPGINARMSEIHAAIGLASLDGLFERVAWRNELVAAFKDELRETPGVSYQEVPGEDVSTYKDLTLVVDAELFGLSAAELGPALLRECIDSRRYYWPPIHMQKAYANTPRERDLPATEQVAGSVLTPPLYSHMTERQVRGIARAVATIQEHAKEVRQALT